MGDSSAAISSSALSSTNRGDVVIGLDDDLIAIKDRLCGASSKLQIVPIVGMGGIGNSTLARNAFDDLLVVEYFHIRAWVTISQDYSADRFILSLLDSMNLFRKEQVLGDESLMAKVYKNLKGRGYLIVLDDVWDTGVWDDMRYIFPDDGNGSRIMLTTRLSNIGVIANSSSPLHQMRFMDEDQSWDLFKQKVFMAGKDCPSELEAMGKEITFSCGGLPLAIVLVAGFLSAGKRTRDSWEEITKNLKIIDGKLEKILSLSYKHLPQHLRPCFLFIGGFPEDYEIHVSRLFKIWVAEGFLKYDNECKSFEDKTEEYLEDLVKRNLVLVVKRKTNGKIKTCSLHDLVRDLCKRKAYQEKFLEHVTKGYAFPKIIQDLRCISLIDCDLKNIWAPTIRSNLKPQE